MKPHPPEIDERYRSLLQKAVRRGHVNLVLTTCSLLESIGPKEKNWLRKRTANLTFEICWPLGREMAFNKRFYSKVAALVNLSTSLKDRNAAGLGSLAFMHSEGDRSVLKDRPEDRAIRLVAKAVRHPDDFWKWVHSRAESADAGRRQLIQNAERTKNIGAPLNRTITQAAVYLAIDGNLPDISPTEPARDGFPYWIVFDRQTRPGRRVLRDIARDLHIPLHQLEWAFYYFEGGRVDRASGSPWWERYCRWRFFRSGIPMEEAHLLWGHARKQLEEALTEDAHQLHKDIYRWKMSSMQKIDLLKSQVTLYIGQSGSLRKGQKTLF